MGRREKVKKNIVLQCHILQGHDGLPGARGPPGDQGPIVSRPHTALPSMNSYHDKIITDYCCIDSRYC